MHTVRRTLLSSAALIALALMASGAASPAGATGTATLPQATVAIPAAQWLANQLTPGGTIDDITPGTPDLSATANAVLALAATSVDPSGMQAAITALESNADTYIAADGSDGPGQLALLILDAEATGADPTDFGGTNLVARLGATEQTSGPDAGLFGTESQVAVYSAGTLSQGLALAALKAAGVTPDANAVNWLVDQQCPDGAWVLPDIANGSCTVDASMGTGPDTNTTALAVQGLVAQDAMTPTMSTNALTFLDSAQNSDGGFGYQPTDSSDPDSTAYVMQALLALGQDPTSAAFTVDGQSPLSALDSFVVTSGTDAGAFWYPGGGTTTGDVLATYQAVPAAAGVVFPFAVPLAPAPTVTSLSSTSGAVGGGTSVTITGTNLGTTGEVHFGTVSAPFTVVSDTQITTTSPVATGPGVVNVTVATLGGTSATSAGGSFTYTAATTTTTTGTSGTSSTTSTLAVTGIDLLPLLLAGSACIGFGSLLLIPTRRRTVALHRSGPPTK